MLIFFIIRHSKTIITISKVIVSTFLINIIVLVLLSKKCNRLSKITKTRLCLRKEKDYLRLRLLQATSKTTISKHSFNVVVNI